MNCQFLKNPHTHSRFYRFSLTDSFSSQINRLVCSELNFLTCSLHTKRFICEEKLSVRLKR
ncbi:hypothetical protein WDU94_004752 [Cyamophila willieti]